MILLALMTAVAADPVVSLGRNVVMDAPVDSNGAEAAAAWTSVLADCAEEAAPGKISIVDRTDVLHSKGDAAVVRELGPKAVVLTHPVPHAVDPEAWGKVVQGVLEAVRVDGGPTVFLIGAVAPTVAQQVEEGAKRSRAELDALQATADERTTTWNARLEKLAATDDGVWYVDVWRDWPRDSRKRAKLTLDGWKLSDQAQARIGGVICDEMLKRLLQAQ